MDAGADLCIVSVHKMGAGLEQGSVFHLQGDLIDSGHLLACADMLATTSPNVLICADMLAGAGRSSSTGMACWEPRWTCPSGSEPS